MIKAEQIREVVEPVLRRLGYELWDLDLGRGPRGFALRVFIEGLGGVTVDDCVRVSRELEPALDVEDVFNGPYTLEVSSPGLERVLRTASHFRRMIGNRIGVRLQEAISGSRSFQGKLVDAVRGEIVVETDGGEMRIAIQNIRRAHVVHEWPTPGAKGQKSHKGQQKGQKGITR